MNVTKSSPEAPVASAFEEDPPAPSIDAAASVPGTPRHARRDVVDSAARTRISGAWAAVAVIVVLGVALVDFIVENTRSVRVDFFSAGGRMPVAVALLAAAVSGAAVVLAVGVCRTAQLRLAIRRKRRAGAATSEVAVPEADSIVATS